MQLLAQQRITPICCKVKIRHTITAVVLVRGRVQAAQAAVRAHARVRVVQRVPLTAPALAPAAVRVTAQVLVQAHVLVVRERAPAVVRGRALVVLAAVGDALAQLKGYGIWQFH